MVFGDGEQTRDFVYVTDVAAANVAALGGEVTGACNIASGKRITLLELIEILSRITGNRCDVSFQREGDIRHSLANTKKMNDVPGISALTTMEQGLTLLLQAARETG